MKREEIQALLKEAGIADEKIIGNFVDKTMELHGKDIEAHKASNIALEAQSKTVQEQLAQANKQIEQFKGMKVEDVQKAADDYKAKYETAQVESAKQIAALKFDHALEGELVNSFKAKDITAVRAHLDTSKIQFNEGKFVGLKEQLEPLTKSHDYLFNATTENKPLPKVVSGGQSQSVLNDPMLEAARKGAGLTPNNKG